MGDGGEDPPEVGVAEVEAVGVAAGPPDPLHQDQAQVTLSLRCQRVMF